MSGVKSVSLKILSDGLCLFLVFLPWIIIQAVNKPYRRGFYCNDNSIKYPFLENTVTNVVLTVCGFIITFAMVTICESVIYYSDDKNRDPPLQLTSSLSIPYFVVLIYRFFGIFLFGLAVQQTLTNIGKYSIGRLRPHFLSVCSPQYSQINCTLPGYDNIFIYVTDYTCADETGKKAVDSRLSFPSGHSSFSVFVAIYLTLYLQSRFTWKGCKFLRPLIQTLLIYGAFYVCLSRVSDFKHHPTDVLSGAILGFFVAALVGVHIANFLSIKDILTRLGYYPPSVLKYGGPSTAINMTDSDEQNYRDNTEDLYDRNKFQLFCTGQSRM